jgi:heme exporter protein D
MDYAFFAIVGMLIVSIVIIEVQDWIERRKNIKELKDEDQRKQEEMNKQAFMQNWINCTMKTED